MDDLEFGEELFVLVGERPWGKLEVKLEAAAVQERRSSGF